MKNIKYLLILILPLSLYSATINGDELFNTRPTLPTVKIKTKSKSDNINYIYKNDQKDSFKTEKQIKKEILEKEIKQLKETKKKLLYLTQYTQKEQNINIKAKTKYVDIFIPFNQISEVLFDKDIKKYITFEKKDLIIKKNDNKKLLTIINKDYMLNQNVKVVFSDDTELNLVLKVGDVISKRHIKYNLFISDKVKNLIPEYQKKLKIVNVHTYFNNVAISMIFNRILENKEYHKYLLNRKTVNKVLYNGVAKIKDITGYKSINYKAELKYVYDTAYIKILSNNEKLKLVMLELNITNNKKNDVLVVSEDFIKNRFDNYVAFYLNDIENEEHYIMPGETKRMLVVVEVKVKEK